jgi:hypothetical protein
MTSFTVSGKLPSCFVDRDLLTRLDSIGAILLDKFPTITDAEHVRRSIALTDGFGVEGAGSITDFEQAFLPETTQTVELSWRSRTDDGSVSVSLRFDRVTYFNLRSIAVEADNARQIAREIDDTINRALERSVTLNSWVKPYDSAWDAGIVTVAIMGFIGILAGLIARPRPIAPVAVSLVAVGALAFWYGLSRNFLPYTMFDTLAQQRRKTIWNYVTLTLIGLLISGSIAAIKLNWLGQ